MIKITVEETNYGTNFYYKKGIKVIHRDDGPAFITPDYIEYVSHNIWNREDGPAGICVDGTIEYCINGIGYSENKFYKKIAK